MTQPDYVPVASGSQLREVEPLAIPESWTPTRPSELAPLKVSAVEQGKMLGTPSPDSGFALKLARIRVHKLELAEGEHLEDVERAVSAIAIKRASFFSRAPVIYDVDFAVALLGYGEVDIPPEVLEHRKAVVSGVSHDYFKMRHLLEAIGPETLAATSVEADLSLW
ncbi:MAG: hypothetical protein M0Z47_02400 [Actinomycetota bacterium]|nr:hypothetical protein [Actinomycetota bacterium]